LSPTPHLYADRDAEFLEAQGIASADDLDIKPKPKAPYTERPKPERRIPSTPFPPLPIPPPLLPPQSQIPQVVFDPEPLPQRPAKKPRLVSIQSTYPVRALPSIIPLQILIPNCRLPAAAHDALPQRCGGQSVGMPPQRDHSPPMIVSAASKGLPAWKRRFSSPEVMPSNNLPRLQVSGHPSLLVLQRARNLQPMHKKGVHLYDDPTTNIWFSAYNMRYPTPLAFTSTMSYYYYYVIFRAFCCPYYPCFLLSLFTWFHAVYICCRFLVLPAPSPYLTMQLCRVLLH